MSIFPEWAPSVHPLLIHFPIVLFLLAVAFDGISLIWSRGLELRLSTIILYALGGISAVGVYFTGVAAGDAVLVAAEANTALVNHSDWALATVWFLGALTVIRLFFAWWESRRTSSRKIQWLLVGLGLVGLALIQQTAERGAKLVFLHGVGVLAVPTDEMKEHDHETDHEVPEEGAENHLDDGHEHPAAAADTVKTAPAHIHEEGTAEHSH